MEKHIEEMRKQKELKFFLKNIINIPEELKNFSSDLTYPSQSERSKREDSCKHEWGSEENSDSSNPFYVCNKCGHEMRCSEHNGNIMREVQ